MQGTIEAGAGSGWRLPAELRLTPRYLGANKTCLTLPAPHSQLRHRTGGGQKNEQRLTHNNIFLVKKQPRLVSGYLRENFIFQSRLVFYVRVIFVSPSSSIVQLFDRTNSFKLYNFVENLARDLKLCCAQYLKLPWRTFPSALKCNGQINTRPRKSLLKLLCQR